MSYDHRPVVAHGLDALGHPAPEGAVAAGYVACGQYLRNTSLQQIQHDVLNGFGVWLIDEHNADESLSPPQAWAQRADAAVAEMLSYGATPGVACYATADTGINRSAWPIIEAGWREYGPRLQAHGFRRGYYCGEQLGDHLLDLGLIDLLWGVGATSWDGYDPDGSIHFSSRAVMRQLVQQVSVWGVTCDVNNLYDLDVGQWGISPPTPPPPPPKEPDMAYAYKLPDKDQIWLPESRPDENGSLHQWYAPIGGPSDVEEMVGSGLIAGVRPLATDPKDGGNPEWDAAFTAAQEAGRVVGA